MGVEQEVRSRAEAARPCIIRCSLGYRHERFDKTYLNIHQNGIRYLIILHDDGSTGQYLSLWMR